MTSFRQRSPRTACSGLLLAAAAGSASTQPAGLSLDPVVVRGQRASLHTAQERRRDSPDIVDAVLADDIGKLPDLSVGDALQRVTGVQIARDRGDGTGLAVRGLTQLGTTLNGREVFSARLGRSLDPAELPAELLSGLEVHKSSTARQLEGGIGASIDLRTYRPFELPAGTLAASGRWLHGRLVGRGEPQGSLLASHRWSTGGSGGEFGVLLSLADQRRAFREDQLSMGTPTVRGDLLPGREVVVPSNHTQTSSAGLRHRRAASLIVQWRLDEALELYAERTQTDFLTRQDSHQIGVAAGSGFVPGSLRLFPGTDDLQRITWTDAPVSVLSFARDTRERLRQTAVGAVWNTPSLSLTADLSHTVSRSTLYFSGPFLAASAPRFTQDLSSDLPSAAVDGLDLQSAAGFRYTGLAYRSNRLEGALPAARFDLAYRPEGGWLTRVEAGLRLARRSASNAPGLIVADVELDGPAAGDRPDRVSLTPYRDFFDGRAPGALPAHLVDDLGGARDAAGLRAAFGIDDPLPVAGNPLSVWDLTETTRGVYLMGSFGSEDGTLTGQAGARLVQTRLSVSGTQSVPGGSGTRPIALESGRTDWLPSLNLHWRAGERLSLRLAASRTISRPELAQLSPSLTLLGNSIDPSLNQGSAGNPGLRPVRSDNLDLAVETWSGRSRALSLSAFAKRVDGFVTTVSRPETHGGIVYQVSRPRNGQDATVRGLEFGWLEFNRAATGPLAGSGLQFNYTFADSDTQVADVGRLPLSNLSRHSANLIGLYERGPLTARLAYNWRSRFLGGLTSVVGIGQVPVFTRAYGWLDASLSWQINRHAALRFDGGNLLGSVRRSEYGVATRPASRWLGDTQLGLALSLRL